MPRLPSSIDVDTVSPRVAADPGVSAPVGAFQSPIGIAAGELAPGFEKLAEVAQRQENRRDTVDRASRINQYNLEADDDFRKRSTEQDFSDEKVLNEYATSLGKRRQELLKEHTGSPDSQANLAIRLQDIESSALGRAAAYSTSLGREKVLTTFDRTLSPVVNRATLNPTRQGVDAALVELETTIGDLKGALDPKDEETLRNMGREHIALGSLNSLIVNGRIETAEALLNEGKLVDMLGPQSVREVNQRINTVRATRDETLRKISQMETVLGRRLNEPERLQVLGLGKTEELVEIHDPSSPSGIRLVPRSQASGKPGVPKRPLVEQTTVGSIPAGYQLTRDPTNQNTMRMEPIPGGPADTESKARQIQQREQQRLTARQSKLVVRDVDRSLSLIEESIIPAAGAVAGSLAAPGTSAFQLQRQMDSIKARIGFDQLQAMRAASPTGGALGQISERENVLLQSVLGSLDIRQDPEILKENLRQVREIYLNAWFGTPEEHQAAIDEGRMTPQQAKSLQKERETVGFDAIGRALDPQPEKGAKAEKGKTELVSDELTTDEIMAMGIQELSRLDLKGLSDDQITAVEKRFAELK